MNDTNSKEPDRAKWTPEQWREWRRNLRCIVCGARILDGCNCGYGPEHRRDEDEGWGP